MSPSSTRSTRMVLAAGAKICGARLGFRRGDHCRVLANPGQPHCSGHLNAYARIAEAEADIRRTTQAELDQYRAADYHRLKALLDNAAALARTWWFDNGVRAISTHLREEVLSSGPCAYCGDPRWQTARSAYLNTESGFARWRVAVEVMFRIETEYTKEADPS